MMTKINLILLIILSAGGVGRAGSSDRTGHPIAKGTFIQQSLVKEWDDTRWQAEFSALKEVGMEYLVFAPVLDGDKEDRYHTCYPTDLTGISQSTRYDLLDNCLRNAQKAGFKVFIGLNFHDKWWQSFDADWLDTQMELGNKVAEEVYRKYANKYPVAFYGWYWVWEIDNLRFNEPDRRDMLVKALNTNRDFLYELAPEMPFMQCPFMNSKVGGAAAYGDFWKYIFSKTNFKKGDIFAPQDCIGAGGLEIDQLDSWFAQLAEAVKTKPGLLFWSDAETFEQRFWSSAPLNRFVEQMRIVEPYVSKIISFAYSHYYSPGTVSGGFHGAYLRYVKTGELPRSVSVAGVTNLRKKPNEAKQTVLTWDLPKDSTRIAGYLIYRNGVVIGNVQAKGKKLPSAFTDTTIQAGDDFLYHVKAYDFVGTLSR